jgi:hypothetical protein
MLEMSTFKDELKEKIQARINKKKANPNETGSTN